MPSHGFFHDRCPQPLADQLEHSTVGDPPLDTRHQLMMRDRVEVAFQISIVDGIQTIPQSFLHRVERIVHRARGAEPIRDGQKICLEDRLHDQLGCRPDHPIADRGNTQQTLPAVRLGGHL